MTSSNVYSTRSMLNRTTRRKATKALINISEKQYECMEIEGPMSKSIKKESNIISFTGNLNLPTIVRTLYMTDATNGLEVRIAFINSGASVNIVPMKTFKCLDCSRTASKSINVTGLSNKNT